MRRSIFAWALGAIAGCGLLAGAPASQAQTAGPADSLEPGLEVCYIYGFVRHIDEMLDQEGRNTCKPGEPLTMLNSRVGAGKVLTSASDNGVMARIAGLIHLDTPGFYSFAFESNDGVRLEIDGEIVVEDPGVHSDRFSDIGAMEVAEPGWHPLTIRYFERKVTSTLRFFWQPPGGEGTMALVPAEALAHKAP
jgi:hypothetical protein